MRPNDYAFLSGDCLPEYRGRVVRLLRFVREATAYDRKGNAVCWDGWEITAHWLRDKDSIPFVPVDYLRPITDYVLAGLIEREAA